MTMSGDVFLWCGTLFIAVAALVILGGRWAPAPAEARRTPVQQLMRMSDADALYVDRFLDVNTEPWMLTLPDVPGRNYLFQVLSGRADVFDDEATEHVAWTRPHTYAIIGPDWNGTLPPGVTMHRSPAPIVWLLGRIERAGTPEDDEAVRALLNQISLIPLSLYGIHSGVPDPRRP
jgi:hypothetical protein